MRFSLLRATSVLLVLLTIATLFCIGCAPVVQPSDNMTPDPEPTDVPIEMQTIAPTAIAEETPQPEMTAEPETTAVPEPTGEPEAEYILARGSVHSSKLNVRSGPDTSYKVIDTLYREARLLIFEVDGYWLRVQVVDSGVEGYVFGKYVGLDGSSISAYGFGLTHDDAKLYADATDKSEVLGIVPRGSSVTIYYSDKKTGYYCVSVHDTLKEGFIAPLYMSIVCRVKPSDADFEGETGYISGNLVNMRSGPGTGYRVIDKLTKGTELNVLEAGINWYNVQVVQTGISGYVYADYVTLDHPGTTPPPEPPELPDPGDRGFINANGVNIRSGPSADYDSLGKLDNGEPVSFEGSKGNWFKVSALYARLVGWVYADFIDFPDPTPTPQMTPQPR